MYVRREKERDFVCAREREERELKRENEFFIIFFCASSLFFFFCEDIFAFSPLAEQQQKSEK